MADPHATNQMFDREPTGREPSAYHIQPAKVGRELIHGDIIDLDDRAFEVVHTLGHSPGGIGLFERKTGI